MLLPGAFDPAVSAVAFEEAIVMKHAAFATVDAMVRALAPSYPVMCIYPAALRKSARAFLDGVPGRALLR